eukprot:TRINITY_DN732_c0_g1_i9.p1 TRINITY_DN732_c0_g1~~TRINITY_DN732_c0_g1_i9.p1  ORF type:complete len:144 (+),score=21.62 TRINITY_DN732_c0_g1_i9:499-930(+)
MRLLSASLKVPGVAITGWQVEVGPPPSVFLEVSTSDDSSSPPATALSFPPNAPPSNASAPQHLAPDQSHSGEVPFDQEPRFASTYAFPLLQLPLPGVAKSDSRAVSVASSASSRLCFQMSAQKSRLLLHELKEARALMAKTAL